MTDTETVQLAKDHLAEAYKEGGKCKETADFYNKWAKGDDYDKHLNKELYTGPKIAAESVADYFPSGRENIKILDVAAGTGFVAECLLAHGFVSHNMDALDPSEVMLKKAKGKNVYNHLICAYLDENKLPVLEDTYDCAVMSGGMGEGHIPFIGLGQLIRVVKPGGLICNVMRKEYLNHSQYKDKLEPHMEKLANEGQWELISRTVAPNYCLDHDGLVHKYKVLGTKYSKEDPDTDD